MSPRFFATPQAFRRWLAANHASATELWVGFWKKSSGKKGLTYEQAVDEALCHGWIDGLKKGYDDDAFVQRFTPRRANSIWSVVNIRKIRRLRRLGRVAAPGIRVFEARDPKRTRLYSSENRDAAFPAAAAKRFRARRRAWAFFQKQPPGYRHTATHWVTSAKREETRARRLALLIEHCTRGERLPQLTGNGVKPKR